MYAAQLCHPVTRLTLRASSFSTSTMALSIARIRSSLRHLRMVARSDDFTPPPSPSIVLALGNVWTNVLICSTNWIFLSDSLAGSVCFLIRLFSLALMLVNARSSPMIFSASIFPRA